MSSNGVGKGEGTPSPKNNKQTRPGKSLALWRSAREEARHTYEGDRGIFPRIKIRNATYGTQKTRSNSKIQERIVHSLRPRVAQTVVNSVPSIRRTPGGLGVIPPNTNKNEMNDD